MRYFPFPGRVHGHPSGLDGTIDEIVADARRLEANGADGLDLLTDRHVGDAPRLLREVVSAVSVPVVSAGSIATYDRVTEVAAAGAWGFTIGSAFFEGQFVPGGFDENLMAMSNWLRTH